MSVYKKINQVMHDVEYVQKDAQVQGYKAVSHDAVVATVRRSMIKHGLLCVPSLIKSEVNQVGQTKSGAAIIRYDGEYAVSFIDADSEGETSQHTMVVEAHANDHGDKAPGKALSYATKSALLKMFLLETGVNDEGRAEFFEQAQEAKKTITEKQEQEIKQLIDETGSDLVQFKKHFNIVELSDLKGAQYKQAMVALEGKKNGNS